MFRSQSGLFKSIDFDTALHRALRGWLIDSDFGPAVAVTRHGQEVTVQLRHENRCLRPKTTRDLPQGRVVVSIVLFEDLHKLITRKINALQLCVVRDIVDQADAGYASCHLTGLR